MAQPWMRAICQYLINCNAINQSAKGWSCSGGALCQPHSSYSSFSLEKAPRKSSNQQKRLWAVCVCRIPLCFLCKSFWTFRHLFSGFSGLRRTGTALVGLIPPASEIVYSVIVFLFNFRFDNVDFFPV